MFSLSRLLGWVARRIKRILKGILFAILILLVVYLIRIGLVRNNNMLKMKNDKAVGQIAAEVVRKVSIENLKLDNNLKADVNVVTGSIGKVRILETKSSTISPQVIQVKEVNKQLPPCQNVHIFYYPWYGNPSIDKVYIHWNHRYLPHWNANIAKNYPNGVHVPPDDIGANFYPQVGAYSSANPDVIRNHMQQLQQARVGVVVVSYYPPGMADDNGKDWTHILTLLLEIADEYGLKITFHIEPYKDRNEESVRDDIINIIDSYAMFPAFYNYQHNGKKLPLIYVYDSYHTKAEAWAKVLKEGSDSIRGTTYDAVVIGLVVEEKDLFGMIHAGFDGFYTYFAADGFTFGSTRTMWYRLTEFASKHNLIFIPSVGPGYIDTRVRPWNGENTRKRLKGKYYQNSWETALQQHPQIISITSFNEWHEGTQIEKAIPKTIDGFKYSDYSPHGSDYYLTMTKDFVEKFQRCGKHI